MSFPNMVSSPTSSQSSVIPNPVSRQPISSWTTVTVTRASVVDIGDVPTSPPQNGMEAIVVSTLGASVPIVTRIVTGASLKIYTIDAQPPECSSRWVYYSESLDAPIITSGNYADRVYGIDLSLSPAYWRTCYP